MIYLRVNETSKPNDELSYDASDEQIDEAIRVADSITFFADRKINAIDLQMVLNIMREEADAKGVSLPAFTDFLMFYALNERVDNDSDLESVTEFFRKMKSYADIFQGQYEATHGAVSEEDWPEDWPEEWRKGAREMFDKSGD